MRALALRDPEDAAKGAVFAATATGVRAGTFLSDGQIITPSEAGRDVALAQDVFRACEKMLDGE